jgi:acetyl esterase
MPIDPALEPLLALLNSPDVPTLTEGTPAEARTRFRQFTVDARQPEHLPPVAATEDVTVAGLPARIYRPEATVEKNSVPTLVFLHGGGFVIGDIDTHDDHGRWLCRELGAVVLSVGYRLAPESPWPGPVDDALAAVRWAAGNIDQLGGDPARLAIGGDSAGGNLTAVVAQDLRDAGGPPIVAQLLLYPSVDFAGDYPSRVENAEGYFLTAADMEWFGHHYLPADADPADPRISPLLGNLAGLPPAVVVTAEFDPLRDEGEAYAEALRAAGVTTVQHRFDGLIHGFFGMAPVSPAAEKALRTTCGYLRELLRKQ